MIDNQTIKDLAEGIEDKVITMRREIHKHPELSFKEHNTMKYICSRLDDIGVKYSSEIAGTGVVAIINGEKNSDNSKTLLIRADIDALPITEVSDKEYKSQNNGVMHACGHDAHTAILLGACELINSLKSEFSGYVKFVFQPGEETDGGAEPMICKGVLEKPDVDACVALHLAPEILTGGIQVKPGPFYASPDDFRIKIIGKGGHAAHPANCINPIYVAAKIVSAISDLNSKEEDTPTRSAVVSVGKISGGFASNIIPGTVEITGTARSLTNEVRSYLKHKIGEIANSICEEYGAKHEYEFIELYPPLINNDKLSERLYNTAKDYIDIEKSIFGGNSTMLGEDFAYFAQRVPSVLFKLGSRNEDKGIINHLHHESFDVDEDCLKIGVELFSAFALDFLS